jgi:ATP-dependent Clp protease ATP-binding subunit ClpC
VFERFTDRARRVVVLAQEEVRLLGHGHIGTEHLLLGLLREEEGLAARELIAAGVDLERARAVVAELVGPPEEGGSGHLPFTPGAKRVLELSLREALKLGHNFISTEHLLLGLLGETDGTAATVLQRFLGDPEELRQRVLQAIATGQEAEPGTPCCPRCRAELTKTLTFRGVEAREHEGEGTRVVTVTYCGACGTALGAHPA